MTLQECYEKMGADYKGVMRRFRKEERVLKYIIKFADGMDTEKIRKALAEQDYEHAFRFVHNLKGNSLNLDLTPLYKISDVLCEELRNGAPSRDVAPLLEQLESEYTKVIGMIRQIDR